MLSYSGTIAAGTLIAQGGSLVIGAEQDSVGGSFQSYQNFIGLIDELAIYKRALAPEDILERYNAGITCDTTPPPPPTIDPVTSPTANNIITLRGTKDSNSSIRVNGKQIVAVDALTTWQASYSLQPGQNTLEFTSRDAAGNASAPVTIYVELLPANQLDPDIVGLWHMDGNWLDYSGNGNHGSPYNGATFSSDIASGTLSGSFLQSNDYVAIGNLYGKFPNNTFSIVGWVKLNDTANGGRRAIAGGNGQYSDYAIGIEGNKFIVVTGNRNNGLYYAHSGFVPALHQWYHVAGTFDGSRLKLYVNGELENDISAVWVQSSSGVDFRLGSEYCCSGNNLNGLIDEVAIYKRALAPEDILELYNAGLPGDHTPPTGLLFINDAANYTNSPSITLTLSATDPNGVSQMCISNTQDCTAWETYSTTKAWTLLTSDGSKTVYVRYKDVAGNISDTISATIVLDTTPPDTTITGKPSDPTNSASASFSFTATEESSVFECQLGGGSYALCTSPMNYTGLTEGNHTFAVRATDGAGNTDPTQASFTWMIDATAPSSYFISPHNGSGIINGSFVIKGTASDTGSSVIRVEISINGGEWVVAAGTTAWSYHWNIPGAGNYTIQARATDAAGNVETPQGITVTAYTRTPNSVTTGNRQLLINGLPFTVKGVNYSPVPVGEDPFNPPYGDYFNADRIDIYNRDIPLIRVMEANTMSLSALDAAGDHAGFLDAAYNNGINPVYVIAGYNIDPGLDLTDMNVRNQLKFGFRDMIAGHKNHPVILMWAIGSNLNSASMYGADKTNLFSLINEMAVEAHAEDSSHPVMMPLADEDLISTISTYDTNVPDLDLWGTNVYRGNSFGSLFTKYLEGENGSEGPVSAKPLLITGYGIDAYKDTTEAEDQQAQAQYAGTLWGEITANSAIAVGGVYTEWSDQWWMGRLSDDAGCPEANNPASHGDCGTADSSFPDGYDNFEWWGLMRVSDNGSNPDIVEARAAYNTLQYVWRGVYPLNVGKAGNGSGTVTSAPEGINCGTNCSESYLNGSTVTLTATPGANAAFTGWSGDCTGTVSPLSVLVDRAKTCTATFAINTYTVTPSAGANGSITPNTPQTVNYNSTTSFTVAADEGYQIATVSGCGRTWTGSNPYTTGPITADCTVSTTFENITYTVTTSAGANGSMTPNTPQTVNHNATASFTVTANTGYQIATVSGCGGTWTGNPYTTGPITADCTVSATFTLNQYALTVNKTGTGSGTVGGGGTYDYGTSHDITATAGVGSTFTGWSGDCTGTTSPLSVLVDRAKTCTATFAINTYIVTPSAGANGSITPNTPQTVNYNSTTSFTVTPNTGYNIASVSGCGGTWTGSNPYTTGPITANCTVSATFTIAPAVTTLNAWTNLYSASPNNTSASNLVVGSFTVGSGSQRLLLVSVVMEIGTAANPTISATYGGTALTQIKITANTQREIVWMGYLKDTQIGSGSKALAITYSGATGNASALHVKWASYTGVNQTTPFAGSAAVNTGSTTVTFGSTINYVNNGMTVVVAGNGGTPATGTLTATPSFTAGTATTTNAQTSRTFTTAKHTAAGSYASTTSVTWTGTTSARSGLVVVSLQP